MPRQEFEAVVAQASRKWSEYFLIDSSEQVAVDGNLVFEFLSPPNTIATIKGVTLDIFQPNNTPTIGEHVLYIAQVTGGARNQNIAEFIASYNEVLRYQFGTFEGVSISKKPSNEQLFNDIIKGMTFDDTNGITFSYWNKTDVATTNAKRIVLSCEVEEVRK